MSHTDTQEMCDRAYEHGQDDSTDGRAYIPHLYGEYPPEVQGAYQRGFSSASAEQ